VLTEYIDNTKLSETKEVIFTAVESMPSPQPNLYRNCTDATRIAKHSRTHTVINYIEAVLTVDLTKINWKHFSTLLVSLVFILFSHLPGN